jgi:hypothetical protein
MNTSPVERQLGAMSLALMCERVIAANLERYPAECFCIVGERQWESIVTLKYRMTSPIVKSVGSTLSDGRRNPLLSDKCIQEIEEHNPHLDKSKVADELVWKDCTDFRFKREGVSRPIVMDKPWNVQVRRMKKVATNLPLLFCEPKEDNTFEAGKHLSIQTNKLHNYTTALISSPMSVPLLLESGIGKSVKKFIKECKKHNSSFPTHFPLVNTVANNTQNPKFRGKPYLTQLEMLLSEWKLLANVKGADACSGRHRNTSKEQHLKDLQKVQQTTQWRDLFHALNEREQVTIQSRGAKMRKIRDNLESDRHTIKATNIKKMGNRKLGGRLLSGDSHLAKSSNVGVNSVKISKLNMIRQQSASQKARMRGDPASKTSTFSSSIASSSGQKKKIQSLSSGVNHTSKRNQRTFALGDGKQMKLPNLKRRRR